MISCSLLLRLLEVDFEAAGILWSIHDLYE
jgi:hypothetical protein